MTSNLHRLITLAAALALAAPLAACNEEERPLHFEKGTYQGPTDPPLSPEVIDSLKQRVNTGRF